MSISLRADNRSLLINSVASSYLNTNYLSGVTALVLKNSSGFTVELGDSTTQFNITNPSGTTFRYTWDGTGTSPGIFSNLIRATGSIVVNAQNFSTANNGTFAITGVGTDYFEVTNAAGVAETNETIGTGSIKIYIYALLGELGLEQTEVVQVTAVAASTHTLTVGTTKFAHSESTKVTIIPYNQVRFYHTATAVYSTSDSIAGFTNINADSYFSTVKDTSNTTGFGWFVFSNSSTGKVTTNSNAIPYAGFAENSVKKVLDSFFSDLNNKEQKLISNTEAFGWLNEAYNIASNELNLINTEYNIAAVNDISVVAGTAEYALPSDFGKMTSVYDDTSDTYINKIDSSDIDYNEYSSNITYYYLRGTYIGFSPIPTTDFNCHLRYVAKKTALTSYYDTIDFPSNNYYFLKDYMMFRAGSKLQRQDRPDYYKLFFDAINRMKLYSHKQNAALDAWTIESTSNV